MNAPTQSQERREILVAARRYRRHGYKVSGPDEFAAKPSFLGDFVPDLIAERDDDRVVIEVKRTTSVPGSNDIVELAERVATQSGWRFELIAVPAPAQVAMPDLAGGDEDVKRLLDNDFPKPVFLMIYTMIEMIVSYASAQQGRSPANLAFPALVRDLVARGVIDEDTRRKINDARVRRNTIVQGVGAAPTRGEIKALMKLALELQRDASAADKARRL